MATGHSVMAARREFVSLLSSLKSWFYTSITSGTGQSRDQVEERLFYVATAHRFRCIRLLFLSKRWTLFQIKPVFSNISIDKKESKEAEVKCNELSTISCSNLHVINCLSTETFLWFMLQKEVKIFFFLEKKRCKL